MDLKKLLQQYEILNKEIHTNRSTMRNLVVENKLKRKKLNEIKVKLVAEVNKELDAGRSLYQICMDNFGKIDNNFHVLFALVGKK